MNIIDDIRQPREVRIAGNIRTGAQPRLRGGNGYHGCHSQQCGDDTTAGVCGHQLGPMQFCGTVTRLPRLRLVIKVLPVQGVRVKPMLKIPLAFTRLISTET